MSPKRIKIILPIVIVVVAIALLLFLGKARQPAEQKEELPIGVLVDAITAQVEDIQYSIRSQGTVQPKLMTSLISEVNGRIIAVSDRFVEGGFFAKGDVLITIEQDDYLTAVKAAEANVARASASLEEEKARVRVAEEEWASFAEGVAPELGLRRPQLARELANVRSAEAELERAVRDLSRTEIKAPFAGMLQSRSVNLGQFVTRGSTLGMVFGTDIAEIRLPLTDHDIAFITLPPNGNGEYPIVQLSAAIAGQLHQWQGALIRTEGVLDERSRVIYGVVQFNDPYQLLAAEAKEPLRFGRFVQAQVQGVTTQQVVVLPRNLLRPQNQVLLVDAENKLEFRDVVVQRSDDRYSYVANGLQAGDLLTISAMPNPLPGMQVRLGRVDGAWQQDTVTATVSTNEAQE